MSNESENETVWFNLREFMNYLHDTNPSLYEEALDCVSAAIAAQHNQWLDPNRGDWDTDGETGRMGVNLTTIDPNPDITASE